MPFQTRRKIVLIMKLYSSDNYNLLYLLCNCDFSYFLFKPCPKPLALFPSRQIILLRGKPSSLDPSQADMEDYALRFIKEDFHRIIQMKII